MTFVATDERTFIGSDRYYWLYNEVGRDAWKWTFNPVFGVLFIHEEDALIFKLKFV